MRKFKIELNDTGKDGDWYDFIQPPADNALSRQFRITFNSSANYTEHLSFLDLAIYNLSAESQIRQGSYVRLSAGYVDEFDSIFQGRITSVVTERDGANVVTRLLCMGELPRNRQRINRSYGAKTSIVQILKDIAKHWGLALQYDEAQFAGAPVFIRGYSLNGDIPSVLSKLADQFDFSWAQVNQFLIIDVKEKEHRGKPREISFKTGLIGVPEMSSDNTGFAVDLVVRLAPKIRLNTLIELKNKYSSYNTGNMFVKGVSNHGNLNGIYSVVTISHEGDSWGERWQTKIKALTVKVNNGNN